MSNRSLKTRYLGASVIAWGPVFWVGMNIFMFLKHQQPRPGRDLIVWLSATFVVSECLGILAGFGMWIRARRVGGDHKP